jgi:hypothetical protein
LSEESEEDQENKSNIQAFRRRHARAARGQVATGTSEDRSGDVMTRDGPIKTSSPSLLDLPVEMLAHIFSYLDFGTVQDVLPFAVSLITLLGGAVFNNEFQISCGKIAGGLQQRELELVCRRKRHVKMMRTSISIYKEQINK